jgi:hypothetical protein
MLSLTRSASIAVDSSHSTQIRITKLAARKSLLEWVLRSKQEIGPNTSIACEMGQR